MRFPSDILFWLIGAPLYVLFKTLEAARENPLRAFAWAVFFMALFAGGWYLGSHLVWR